MQREEEEEVAGGRGWSGRRDGAVEDRMAEGEGEVERSREK